MLPNESPDSKKRKLFSKHLDTKIVASDLLQLGVTAMASGNEAEQLASAVIEELKDTHTGMTGPISDHRHQELDEISQDLKPVSETINSIRHSAPTTVNLGNEKDFYKL